MSKAGERLLKLPQNELARAATRPPGPIDRWITRRLIEAFDQPRFIIALWDGSEYRAGNREPRNRVVIRSSRALWRLIRNPRTEFGDLFSAGGIDVEGDLIRFLSGLYDAMETGARHRHSAFWRLWRDQSARPAGVHEARENIHHHYDLGNNFYALWLDSAAMQYTCAYYPSPDMTLEDAQLAKLEHVCRKLRLRPGQTVVEAGCGWGGLARYMARHHGVHVKAYNISREQLAWARERAREEGLDDRVEYIEDDYRNVAGEFDAFVSVGMLEHVGLRHYDELGSVIRRCLRPDGIGLVHSIGRNQPSNLNGWIEKRIFPGAYPPTLREMMGVFEPCGMSVLDVENLRLHYAATLRHWLERYDAAAETVRERWGPDFYRAWRLYLCGSAASFEAGHMQLFQVVFSHQRNNAIPRSRDHLYAP